MIIGIVAVDRNSAIGKGGELPWHYSADMKHFKETTIGHACVMGSRTWRTLKRPLKDRLNIVLTRTSEIPVQDSVLVLTDVQSVLAHAQTLAADLFVIGGEQVYRAFLPSIDRWIVTEVPLVVEAADAFVPEDYLDGFQQTGSQAIGDDLIVNTYDRAVSTVTR